MLQNYKNVLFEIRKNIYNNDILYIIIIIKMKKKHFIRNTEWQLTDINTK